MSIADTLFTCNETPVWTPTTFDPSSLPACLSCTLRLTTQLPGIGTVQPTALGLRVDENPTNVLSINGIDYNLVSAELVFPGLHRLYSSAVSDAEYVITFRNVNDISKTVLLCIPLNTGEGKGNAYFKNLGDVTRSMPRLAELIDPTTGVLNYPGASLVGRTMKDPRPNTKCNPIAYPVNYYVMMKPSFIKAVDFARLHARLDASYVGAPKPVTAITVTRASSLLTYIKSIILMSAGNKDDETGVSTKALKCYRINPLKDVKDDKVYIGGAPAKSTLQDELEKAVTNPVPDIASVQPGDIEKVLAITLGVAFAIVICSLIFYFIWNGTFSKYLYVEGLYSKPVVASKLVSSFKLPTLCPEVPSRPS